MDSGDISGNKKQTFRPDVQGLRAIAVLAVVMYHAKHAFVSGGYVGVDIFFVVSGFLIASILFDELKEDRYSLRAFYGRRIRRIFPALFVMLATVLFVGVLLLPPEPFEDLGRTTIATAAFLSNFMFYRTSGYFDTDSTLKPLLHTWSLGVEEQFYLFFPPLLAIIWKRNKKHLDSVLWIIAACSLVFSILLLRNHSSAAFYWTPSRAFELFIGVIVAAHRTSFVMSARMRDMCSIVGLALIGFAITTFSEATAFPGYAALVPCSGTALMLIAGHGGSSVGGRLISFRPMLYFGDISYSLYLWHWPFLVYGRYIVAGDPSDTQILMLVSGSIVAATLSWSLIERVVMRSRPSSRLLFSLGGISMLAAAGIAGTILFFSGMPSRFSPMTLSLYASADDHNQQRGRCDNPPSGGEIPFRMNCLYGFTAAKPFAAVWGDSHAEELVVALGERLVSSRRSVMQITESRCPPALNYDPPDRPLCAAHNRATLINILGEKTITTVVLVANFARYPIKEWGTISGGYAQIVTALRGSGKKVIVVHQIPRQDFDPPIALAIANGRGYPLEKYGISYAKFESETAYTDNFLNALDARSGAIDFQPAHVLCDESICHAYLASVGSLYFNFDHVSLTGARLLAARLPIDAVE